MILGEGDYLEDKNMDIQEKVKDKINQCNPEYLDAVLHLFDEGLLDAKLSEIDRQNMASQESSELISQLMRNIEEEAKKIESFDHLTGLLGRRAGETKIIQIMKEQPGCMAFVDLDNLKRTNDTMGHLAGDYALRTVGEVLSCYAEDAVISRLGGDEFLYYMIDADKEKATQIVEDIMRAFEEKKAGNAYLRASSLSVGLCMTKPGDAFDDVIKNADRALYHVKQSGKNGYYFYSSDEDRNRQVSSVDLKKLVYNLKQQGSYEGSLTLEYREFAKVYDYIRHLGERYDYTIQIMMITVESADRNTMYIEEREQVMTCMEKMIRESLRSVDVSTRFSSEQFLVILTNAKNEYVDNITNRILNNFHKVYDEKYISVHFDVENLSNIKE